MYNDDNRGNGNFDGFSQTYFDQTNAPSNFDSEYDANMYNNRGSQHVMNQNQYPNQYQNNQNPSSFGGMNPNYPSQNDYISNYAGSYQNVSPSQGQVMVIELSSFSEIQEAIKGLKGGQTVIMNLAKVKPAIIQRALDYLSGAIFAIDGSIQKISETQFILTPKDVKIKIPKPINNKLNNDN